MTSAVTNGFMKFMSSKFIQPVIMNQFGPLEFSLRILLSIDALSFWLVWRDLNKNVYEFFKYGIIYFQGVKKMMSIVYFFCFFLFCVYVSNKNWIEWLKKSWFIKKSTNLLKIDRINLFVLKTNQLMKNKTRQIWVNGLFSMTFIPLWLSA